MLFSFITVLLFLNWLDLVITWQLKTFHPHHYHTYCQVYIINIPDHSLLIGYHVYVYNLSHQFCSSFSGQSTKLYVLMSAGFYIARVFVITHCDLCLLTMHSLIFVSVSDLYVRIFMVECPVWLCSSRFQTLICN